MKSDEFLGMPLDERGRVRGIVHRRRVFTMLVLTVDDVGLAEARSLAIAAERYFRGRDITPESFEKYVRGLRKRRSRTTTGRPPGPGSGNFAALEKKIAARGGVRNPGAVAAAIGRRKYGSKKMSKWAQAGRGF